MYYRKKYEGTITNFSTKKTYRYNAGTTTGSYSCIEEETRILSEAVVDILHDIGYPDAYRDETSGLIFFEKDDVTGIFLGYTSNATYLYYGVNTTATSLATSAPGSSNGTNYQPFDSSKQNYKFYLTVFGEPKGYFVICIGSYSYPTSTTVAALHIFMGKNIVTGDDIMGIYGANGNSAPSSISIYTRKKITQTILTPSMSENIVGDDGSIVLMRKRSSIGIFEFPYLYTGNSRNIVTGQTSFYRLKDGVYWTPNTYYIVKCVTEVSK